MNIRRRSKFINQKYQESIFAGFNAEPGVSPVINSIEPSFPDDDDDDDDDDDGGGGGGDDDEDDDIGSLNFSV